MFSWGQATRAAAEEGLIIWDRLLKGTWGSGAEVWCRAGSYSQTSSKVMLMMLVMLVMLTMLIMLVMLVMLMMKMMKMPGQLC